MIRSIFLVLLLYGKFEVHNIAELATLPVGLANCNGS